MNLETFPGCNGEYEDDAQVVLNPVTQQKIVSGFIMAEQPKFASLGMEHLFGINTGGDHEV